MERLSMKQTSHEHEIESYQEGLVCDVGDLDRECKQHANTHSKIALKAARATSLAAAGKLDLKEREGLWQNDIRDRLREAKAGDGPAGRVTDLQVKAELAAHPKNNRALRDIAQHEAEARDWEALRESSKDRGYQLRNLVDMMIGGLISSRSAKPSRRTAKQLDGAG